MPLFRSRRSVLEKAAEELKDTADNEELVKYARLKENDQTENCLKDFVHDMFLLLIFSMTAIYNLAQIRHTVNG